MLKLSNEFSEYISQVSLDFMCYTHNLVKLATIEGNRQKNIRLELTILLKYYKGMELTERENEILEKHLLQYDYKKDLNRCVYQIVYQISDKTWMRVDSIKNDKAYLMDANIMNIYREYLKALKQYTNSLLHAMCFNHEVILINPVNNEEIRPVMDFDSDCLVEKNILSIKKRKKILK